MLDWARKGLWRGPGFGHIYGQENSEDLLVPMIGQYYEMALCCCNPHIIAVVALPPDSMGVGQFSARAYLFESWVSGGVVYFNAKNLDYIDNAWHHVTEMINPDTNTIDHGNWLVRQIDDDCDRAWKIVMSTFPDIFPRPKQACYVTTAFAFRDDDLWVTRARPVWEEGVGHVGGDGFFTKSEIRIDEHGTGTTNLLNIYRFGRWSEALFFHHPFA